MGSMSPPPPLSALVKSSFAYKTVKDRLPVILTKVIDTVHRHKHEINAAHGEEGNADLKAVIHKLSELRYRLTTDKPLTAIQSQKLDGPIWNSYLKNLESVDGVQPSWFKSTWLDVECYFYRKIHEAFETSHHLREWDPFRFQKEQAFVGALEPMTVLAEHLKTLLDESEKMTVATKKANVENILQISLWGNKCDLSISVGEQQVHSTSPLHQVDALKDKILVNDLRLVVDRLFESSPTENRRIDYVLDNAGMELFADLCLAEFLLSAKQCDRVVFHAKAYPWFVSDTTCADLSWTLEMLSGNNSSSTLRHFGSKWQQRFDDQSFSVKSHLFWTLPHAYSSMPRMAPDLWQQFNDGGLMAIFKGDLNYRKLVGDLNWPPTTDFDISLREFRPETPFVVLRTLKADVVTGMKNGEAEKLMEKDPGWMVTGDYAVIQYYGSK